MRKFNGYVMGIFNQHSRTKNVLTSSLTGATCNLINTLMGFVYRSMFLQLLSASYLGVSGLFTNILQVLSLTDLGISTAITYRFYDPIDKNDYYKVGQLLLFFKKVYRIIASVIFALGMCLYPFLEFFIKDTGELPSDVNIRLVYILFLSQTLSTYLFSYRQTILSADQKQYLASFYNTVLTFVRYALQLCVLFVSKNYTLTLALSIFATIIGNIILSLWVTARYKPVFTVRESLSREEQKQIIQDAKATMMHKIGGTVLNATDSIVLSKYIGLIITGIYSNYSLLINSIMGILNQLLSSFTGSIGSANVALSQDKAYIVYRRLLFANFWVGSMVTTCLFVLINPFILLWVGESMQLSMSVVTVLCVQFYLQVCRKVSTSYTDACGLFVKDRIRPLIEAGLNLGISIFLVIKAGIIGVFLGTIISCLLTVFWREPYILFKYEFKKPIWDYWKLYAKFAIITIGVSFLLNRFQNWVAMESSVINWIVLGFTCLVFYNIIAAVSFWRNKELRYYCSILRKCFFLIIHKFFSEDNGKNCV